MFQQLGCKKKLFCQEHWWWSRWSMIKSYLSTASSIPEANVYPLLKSGILSAFGIRSDILNEWFSQVSCCFLFFISFFFWWLDQRWEAGELEGCSVPRHLTLHIHQLLPNPLDLLSHTLNRVEGTNIPDQVFEENFTRLNLEELQVC